MHVLFHNTRTFGNKPYRIRFPSIIKLHQTCLVLLGVVGQSPVVVTCVGSLAGPSFYKSNMYQLSIICGTALLLFLLPIFAGTSRVNHMCKLCWGCRRKLVTHER